MKHESAPAFQVERLAVYSEEDAAGIGSLMPFLSARLSDEPMSEAVLRTIVESPDRAQLVARMNARIVGAATLNMVIGPAVGRIGVLEDFVTHPDVRGHGVGDALWNEMLVWCREQGVDMRFTSNDTREGAHSFYEQRGAIKKETKPFFVPVVTREPHA